MSEDSPRPRRQKAEGGLSKQIYEYERRTNRRGEETDRQTDRDCVTSANRRGANTREVVAHRRRNQFPGTAV